MRTRLLRFLLGLLHLLFWGATAFVFVSFVGGLRWLMPGANPSPRDLLPMAFTLLLAFALFTVFYVYDTFWGAQEEVEKIDARRTPGLPQQAD